MIGSAFSLRRMSALALVLAGLAGPALAERVAVRSGEHDGFTRLVLDLPRAVAWTLTREGGTARLELSGLKTEFDFRDAFRRISTGRVADLTQAAGESALSIAMGCNCAVEAYRLGPRMLVIDISGTPGTRPDDTATEPEIGTPSSTQAVAPAPVPQPGPAAPQRRYAFPFETEQSRSAMLIVPGTRIVPPAIQPVADASTSGPGPTLGAAPTAGQSSDAPDRTQRLSEAEQRLAEQLSRAAAQGLVTPRAAKLPDPHGHAPNPATQPTEQPAEPSKPGINLRARTSADRDFSRLIGAIAQTGNGETCFADTQVGIADWASGDRFGDQVGTLRGALVGEFDRPDAEAARRLVRLYIHFGFGAEALQVLKVSALSGDGTMLLKSMAEIMEYGHSLGPGPLSNQYECDTHAALWAILSQERIPGAAQINDAAILRAIDTMPPQLRGYLGPKVGERLVAARRQDLAAQVLRIVERGLDTTDAHFELADAAVQLAVGDTHSAARSLDSVVGSNTELSPKALIALIDANLESGRPVDIQTANLAGAYAHEYRKEVLGTELKRVHILALTEAGAYDEAFSELANVTAENTPEANATVRSHAMSALARNAGDLAFLKHALDRQDPETQLLGPDSGNAVADRLIALGFAAEADSYLRPDADGTDGRARRILRARAALAQLMPRRVEADLIGVTGPEADLLRAEARSMSGDHDAAKQLFATLDRTEEMISEAWLALDVTTLRETDDPLWRQAAEMIASDGAADPAPPDGVLARNRGLIEDSTAARRTMSDLLDRLAVEPLPETGE